MSESPPHRARILPDITAISSSPGGVDHGAANSAPVEALLDIVGKAHGLLAKLFRISKEQPAPLRPQGVTEGRFAPVLFDYRYFKEKAALEAKIEATPELQQMDDQFREAYGGHLQEVFELCEQIVGMHASILSFLERLGRGDFIQCSLETLLLAPEGKQLLCESVSLLASLLLALDRKIQSPARERLVVAFYRMKGGSQAVGPSANAVIALCAATGLDAHRRRSPAGYPEAYFARLAVPHQVVLRLINCVRADDIYSQTNFFPAPEHRTTALSAQASLLYLLLCFSPQTLHRDGPLMRTLVDRHFADCWVVPWGHACYTDLAMEWDSFRAARAALAGVVSVSRARDVAATTTASIPEYRSQLAAHLSKGHLTEEYVLEHQAAILAILRNSNVALRWLLLHSWGAQKKLRGAVAAASPPGDDLLNLLLSIAQLESEVKGVYSKLLETRGERWTAQKAALKSSIQDLANFISALASLPNAGPGSGGTANTPDFSVWFQHLHQQVDSMVLEDPAGSSRRVQGVVAALNELERFHSGEAALQTVHYLTLIRNHLAHLLRLSDVRPEIMHSLAAISDFSYGWGLLDAYAPRLQAQIRKQPGTVGKLSSLFMKARSMLEMPLMRLSQAKSGQLEQVSRFYSTALLQFAQRVLQVIPGALWDLMDKMTPANGGLEPLGSRIQVSALRDAAQLEQRAALASHASQIAAFASGVHQIDRSSIGVLELDAMSQMEEGLRQLLKLRIGGAAATLLTFPQACPPLVHPSPFKAQRGALASVFGAGSGFSSELPGRQDLGSRLVELGRRLEGVRAGLEAIQDFLGLPSQQMWHQQVAEVMAGSLVRDVSHVEQSWHRTRGKPPAGAPAPTPTTFLGRVCGEMLRLSQPQRTQYRALGGTWEDAQGNPALGPAAFQAAGAALGTSGLCALDRLLALRTRYILKDAFSCLKNLDAGSLEALRLLPNEEPTSSLSENPGDEILHYSEAARRLGSVLGPLEEVLLAAGQAQLLRRAACLEVRDRFLLDGSQNFGKHLEVVQSAVLDMAAAKAGNSQALQTCLEAFVPLAERCGMQEPLEVRYVHPDAKKLQHLPDILFLLMLTACSSLAFDRPSGMLVRLNKHAADGGVLAVGLTTLMRQLPHSFFEAILRVARRWVQSYVQAVTGSVAHGIEAAGIQVTLPREVGTLLAFLEEMGRYNLFPDQLLSKSIPFVYDTWSSCLD